MPIDPKKTYTTPPAIAVYPRLTEPDTKFNAAGVYSIRTKFTEEAAAPLIEELMKLYDEAYADNLRDEKSKSKTPAKLKELKKADLPWKAELDDETGEPTGNIIFNFKMTATGKNKQGKEYTRKPALYDARGNSLLSQTDLKVGGGSTVRIAYQVGSFYTSLIGSGISLRLQAVQILKLVSFGDRDASAYGFGQEDDGYNSSDEPAVPPNTGTENPPASSSTAADF